MTDAQFDKLLAAINALSAQIGSLASAAAMSENEKPAPFAAQEAAAQEAAAQWSRTYGCAVCGWNHLIGTTCPNAYLER